MPLMQWRDSRVTAQLFVRVVAVVPVYRRRVYTAAIVLQTRRGNVLASHNCTVPAPYVDSRGNWTNCHGPAVYQSPDHIRFTEAQAINALTARFLFLDSCKARRVVRMAQTVLTPHLKG